MSVGRALDLMGRKDPPVAMCPRCPGEPLVFTFERAGFEFTCLGCNGWFGFLDPRPADSTPELDALTEQRKAEYRMQLAERTRP
ncbi:MAG: hypothetical protein WAV64_01950 [Candidatus Moraniibacteriota bacterium]